MQRRKRARTQRCECNGMRDAAISVLLDSVFQGGVVPADGTCDCQLIISGDLGTSPFCGQFSNKITALPMDAEGAREVRFDVRAIPPKQRR